MSGIIRSLCVFCGSSVGRRPEYATAARELARLLAQRGIRLVYGGGNVGLMGVLADEALAHGGEVIGVIPEHLMAKELGHSGVSELRIVGSMHERKALMAELSDAFVALPGGIGTLEELLEIVTWAQLGLHAKPCGLLDVCDYYRHLLDMLARAAAEGFLRPEHQELLVTATTPAELLDKLARHQPPQLPKWMDRDET
jgi:uncharacterized protein (TIGR00730 family)